VLSRIVTMVNEECARQQLRRSDYRFSRRTLRDFTGLADTQLRVHLERLVELEYLLVHRGLRGQLFVYELLFDGEVSDTAPHLCGLIDVATMVSSRGVDPCLAGSTRGHRGPCAGGSRSAESTANAVAAPLFIAPPEQGRKTHLLRANGRDASHVQGAAVPEHSA
jgi:hypothetical protein